MFSDERRIRNAHVGLARSPCGRGFFHGPFCGRHSAIPFSTFEKDSGMKQTCCALALVGMTTMGIVAFQWSDASAKPAEKPVERFMQQKLTHAQDVLEGLVMEDFDQIEKAAGDLHALSQAAEWQVLRTPSYDLFSKEFQSACTQLEKAAKEKNIDGASLAWVRVTMNCLSCHKHVRNSKVVEAPRDLPFPQTASTGIE
jgi:hypothetical protein